jgi:hypothetical protein
MTMALALGACARVAPGSVVADPRRVDVPSNTLRFDNDGREHVHVYLIGAKREWLLGRVEPGAKATLRIPEEAMAQDAMFVRLAVLTGERVTFQASRSSGAKLTTAQPASAILSQRWRFSQGELTSLGQ